MRTITSMCLMIVVISIAMSTLFGVSLTKSKVKAVGNNNLETWTIANNIEYISIFFDGSWQKCSQERKTTAIQIVANIECRYLGLPHELNVITTCLPENTLGSYDDKTHTIQINIGHFEDSEPIEILNTICHEAYHAYQNRLVDAYDDIDEQYKNMLFFYNVEQYKEEFESYSDGDDFIEYYIQTCEITARAYASDAVQEYEERISEYLNSN